MNEESQPVKAVISETTTIVKRQEGESASLSFAGSRHLTKWLIAAVSGLFLNLGHSVIEDFLPAKGETQRPEAQSIKEKLDEILVMKTDVETLKVSLSEAKVDIREIRQEMISNSKR